MSLARLRQLTPMLATLDELSSPARTYVDVACESGGPCFLFPIDNVPGDKARIVRAYIASNSIIGWHTHEVTEIITLWQGCLTFEFQEREAITLKPSDVIRIPPNQEHRAIATEETWMYAVTIPAEEAYPVNGTK